MEQPTAIMHELKLRLIPSTEIRERESPTRQDLHETGQVKDRVRGEECRGEARPANPKTSPEYKEYCSQADLMVTQIHALLPTATVCRAGISSES